MISSGISSAVRRRGIAIVLMAGLIVAACSGSTAGPTTSVNGATATPATTPTATPTATATVTPTPTPTKGPATQNLTLGGPAGKAGAVTLAGIRCNLATTDGTTIKPQITVLARPADPNLSVFIFVQPGSVTVRYDSGAGATYVERDFAGTGVTNFNAATGATIDSTLTEAPTQGAHGNIGILTSITGSIDCGNQLPGSAALTFSGSTPKGALGASLQNVNVECTSSAATGSYVSVQGIMKIGSTLYLVIIAIRPTSFSFFAAGDGFFLSTKTAVSTLTANGGHVDGSAVEESPAAGKKASTVHLSGDATCGTTVVG